MQVLFFINVTSVCKYSLEIPFYLHQLFRNRFECIYTRSTKFMFIARALGENNKNKVKVKSQFERQNIQLPTPFLFPLHISTIQDN